MMQSEPIQAFLDWYRSTPMEIRTHIAFLTPANALSGESDRVTALSPDNFCARIQALDEEDMVPWRTLGIVLMLCTFVDYTFHGKSTEEDWARARARARTTQLRMLEIAEERKLGFADYIREALEMMEFRSRQWMEVAKSWTELRSSALSFPTLERLERTAAELSQARMGHAE